MGDQVRPRSQSRCACGPSYVWMNASLSSLNASFLSIQIFTFLLALRAAVTALRAAVFSLFTFLTMPLCRMIASTIIIVPF